MRHLLLSATAETGIITRARATQLVPAYVLDDALRAGALIRLFPGVFTVPGLAADPVVRRRAVLTWLPDAALSHLDALDVWGCWTGHGLVPST